MSATIATAKLGRDAARITEDDLLWCSRGGSGEGLDRSRVSAEEWRIEHRALASCFLQRWMYLRAVSPAYRGRPLGYLAQYHSQPINPVWLPGGAMYERYKGTSEPAVQPSAVEARIRRREKPLSAFDAEMVAIYRDTLTGRIPLVESGHDWGAVTLYDGHHGLDYSTTASRDRTAALAVPSRDNDRDIPSGAAAKPVRYVAIPGQSRRGNIFSTFPNASYASIVGGVGASHMGTFITLGAIGAAVALGGQSL